VGVIPARVHYRPAEHPEQSCASCSFYAEGHCKMFDAEVTPGYVCDEWEGLHTTTAVAPTVEAHNEVIRKGAERALALEGRLAGILEPILAHAGREAAARFAACTGASLQAAAFRRADWEALLSHPDVALAPARFLLAAGADEGIRSNSTMVAVKPRPDEASAIADPDGKPAETLHVTLAYLGEIDGPLEQIAEALRPVAATHAPLAGIVGGYGQFGTPSGEVIGILLPDVPGLVELRVAVTQALTGAEISYGREHGFEAHLTADTDPEPDEPEVLRDRYGASLHFDELLIVRGDTEIVPIPLVGTPPLTAAAPGPPPWHAPAGDEIIDVPALVRTLRTKTDPVRLALIRNVMGEALGEPGMTLDEALAYYHSPKAFELNAALREGHPLTKEQQTVINTLDAAMRPSGAATTLYRGFPNYPDVFGKGGRAGLTGKTWSTPGYSSTSAQREVAEQFAGGVAGPDDKPIVMAIDVPKGTPMLRVPAGEYGDQDEWLLPRELRIGLGDTAVYTDPFGEQTVDVLSSALNKGVLSSATAGVASGPGIGFDITNPLTAKVLAQSGSQITNIAETTQLNVMRTIREAYDQGLSIPDTAKAIRAGMADAAGPRATLIARTELAGAVNGGSLAATQIVSQATGDRYVKKWLTAPGAPFPRHELYEGLDGQTQPLDGLFDVGGSSLQFPGDPDGPPEEVCNCRCTMSYNTPEGEQQVSADEG
jgi:hypothetical protein